MNKLAILAATAASMVALASPAAAQTVTGTVNITGTVAPKCLVVPGAGDDFGTTVALGELADTDGTLATDLATRFSSVGGTALEARVVCTSAAPTIAVDATEITSATAAVSGYANRIDFTAHVFVDTTTTTDVEFTNSSTGAALTATLIGGRLANNGGNNILITADNFATPGADDLLVAANDYTGSIVINIAPGA
jgi:type 1 fimbria pilin